MRFDQLIEKGAAPIHAGGLLACMLLMGAGWLLGLGPLMDESQQATTVQEQAMQAEQEAKLSKSQLDQLTAKLDEVREQLDQQPVSLEQSTRINPLLAQLAQWADDHRLSITSTKAGRSLTLAYYDYVPITVAGEGGFGDLLAFIKTLHQGRGDIGVIAFNARRLTQNAAIGFELELAWYVLGEEAEADPEQATAAAPTGG